MIKRFLMVLTLVLASLGVLSIAPSPAGATPSGCGFNGTAFAATSSHGEGCDYWTGSAAYPSCLVYNTQSIHQLDPTNQWIWHTTVMQYWNCPTAGGFHPIGYVANVVTYDNILPCMRNNGGGRGYLEFWGSNFSGAAGCLVAGQGRPCALERGGAGYGYGAHVVNDTGTHMDIWCLWAYGPQYDPNGGLDYNTGYIDITNNQAIVYGYNTPLFTIVID
jgi:hypothetical protein